MEDRTIKCIGRSLFLFISEKEKCNSFVAKSCCTFIYFTAKFDTRQDGQEPISSNLLSFVAFSYSYDDSNNIACNFNNPTGMLFMSKCKLW